MPQTSGTPTYSVLLPGDPAPWFRQNSTSNPSYVFDTVAGRYIVLCFFGTASDEAGRGALAAAIEHRDLFDDQKLCLFGVSIDPRDQAEGRVKELLPGIRHFWDFDLTVSRLYGSAPKEESTDGRVPLRRF